MVKFSTKAETLSLIERHVKKSNILPQICFTVEEFEKDAVAICEKVAKTFLDRVIVRSSALSEDSCFSSQAGKFLSIMNVDPKNVMDSIREVIGSFEDNRPDNQVFIQPMLKDIKMSGVLFTVCPNTGGNYFVINYDMSGASDSVTSGTGRDLQTCYIFHGHKNEDAYLNRLTEAAEELVDLFGDKKIDIEFAYDKSDKLYILQARPLILAKAAADYSVQKDNLKRVHSFIEANLTSKPNVMGKRTIYGVMPDWNPAEMIGIRPKPFSLSLYRRVITDGIWAYQRNNYGYKNLRSFPLMVDFCGMPYIDSRVCFNSFIPKDLDEDLTRRLADYYLDSFAGQPQKHDKVEFDIVFSCYTFDLKERLKILGEYGFSVKDRENLQEALRKLTNNVINVSDGLWISDTEKIEFLKHRRQIIADSGMDKVSKIYWLLEDCARYGTLPFAGLARAGFIAVLILKSLVSVGIINDEEYENYMGQLDTVGSQMAADHANLSRRAFLRKYGHLRPGTYDIMSKRYDQAPDVYFGENTNPQTREKTKFSLSLEQYGAIGAQMKEQGFDGDVLALFKFIKAGIEGRELSKFVFTKSLSDAMELFVELGNEFGFSREDMSFADISVIDRLYSSTDDIKVVLQNSIAKGREKYASTLSLTLPPVIINPDDIYSFFMPCGQPNFITLGNVTGKVCTDVSGKEPIADKILLIPAADPGYDWIFSHNIKGFVTAYGGANSHMAIRAGELGIPAVIGAGEKYFAIWKKAQTLHIDCANKKVEVFK